jgi:hypothetical protein
MPDFIFTNPEGKRFTVTGPEGATKEQAWSVLQQNLSGANSQRDSGDWWRNDPVVARGRSASGPADWGAVPAEPEGPARWGAIPVKQLETKQSDIPGVVSGVGRAFARGAPIVGGLLNRPTPGPTPSSLMRSIGISCRTGRAAEPNSLGAGWALSRSGSESPFQSYKGELYASV